MVANKSSLPLPADDNLIAAHMDIKQVERPWRRAGNIAAVEIVDSVVAGAPDLAQIVAILHGAAQMRASRGEGTIRAVAVHDQQTGTAAEPENLRGIRPQFRELGGDDLVAAKVRHRRRDEGGQH